MNNFIGTSGWYYPGWKNLFYPKEIKQSNWLSYYTSHFNTVELNSSFYALPKLENLKLWYLKTPANFLFAIKAWNQLTHKKRLVDCQNELNSFFKNIELLNDKIGPILFQLPYNFHKDTAKLANFIKMLPQDYHFTFELRHQSWWDNEIYDILNQSNIAFCVFELAKLKSPQVVTANFIYIRLHGNEGRYLGKYSDENLLKWNEWIKPYKHTNYIYFDNTMRADDAIINAKQMMQILG